MTFMHRHFNSSITKPLKDIYHRNNFLQWLRRSATLSLLDIIDSGYLGLQPLEKHVVICGFPRGGTTLLQAILETCISGTKSFGREIDGLSAAMLFLRNHSIMISKRPGDIFLIDKIRTHYSTRSPRPKFIILIRDPRSVLTSFHYTSSSYYVSVNRWRSIYSQYLSVKELADIFVLRFEELVMDIDGIQSALGSFLEYGFDLSFSDFYKRVPDTFQSSALHSVRPIDPSTISKWKDPRHYDRLRKLLEHEMPELPQRLIELKYERDDSWTREYVK